jgi:cytidylate kinase
MGRIVALEDLVLAGRSFRLALSGEPYTGKTEVGALVARRLSHRFIGTAALSRALALVERRLKAERGADVAPRVVVKELFARGFAMEPLAQAPFYAATLHWPRGKADTATQRASSASPDTGEAGPDNGDHAENITDLIREADRDLVIRAGALLDDENVRQALKDELEKRQAFDGIVVEGVYADAILGARAKAFHLTGDAGVRRARLMAHRGDTSSAIRPSNAARTADETLDEDGAAALLARLDAEAPRPPPDATLVDVGSRPAAAAALAVLVHLLPASRRPPPDLSNRRPL